LPAPGAAPPADAPLYPSHQRQSGAVHQDGPAGVGVCARVSALRRAAHGLGRVAALLQLASPAHEPRWPASDHSSPGCGQAREASQLVGPPARPRESRASPPTKKSPMARMAARWFPDISQETRPNTNGPITAPVLPTSE